MATIVVALRGVVVQELVLKHRHTTQRHGLQYEAHHTSYHFFLLYDYARLSGVPNAFALAERGMLRRYTPQGVAALASGLIDVSLSGYSLLLDFENLLFANQVLFTGVDIDSWR